MADKDPIQIRHCFSHGTNHVVTELALSVIAPTYTSWVLLFTVGLSLNKTTSFSGFHCFSVPLSQQGCALWKEPLSAAELSSSLLAGLWSKSSERHSVLCGKAARLRLALSPYFMLFGRLCRISGKCTLKKST